MSTQRAPNVDWTRQHLLATLYLYTQLPFGKLHRGNPKIIELASWLGRSPSSVAMKLTNLASLDPVVAARGRKGLDRATALDRTVWAEFQANWDVMFAAAEGVYNQYAEQNGTPQVEELPEDVLLIPEGRTRTATVQVRVNQWKFRKSILANYNSRCCISGLANDQLLNASHILRWSDDTKNRMNPQNGLCLSSLHDKAFEVGLLTVMPDLRVRISEKLTKLPTSPFVKQALLRFDNKKILLPDRYGPDPRFLEVHARRFGFIA
ncbi:MAG: HNH endonuclease [Ramlibacter sp.]